MNIDKNELESFVKVFNKEYRGKDWTESNFFNALDNWLKEKEEPEHDIYEEINSIENITTILQKNIDFAEENDCNMDDVSWGMQYGTLISINQAKAIVKYLQELIEHEQSFKLHHEADLRGIKMWQEKTGKTNTWPDHGKLICFLLEKIDELEAQKKDG